MVQPVILNLLSENFNVLITPKPCGILPTCTSKEKTLFFATAKERFPNDENSYWVNFYGQQYNSTARNPLVIGIKSKRFNIILIYAKKLTNCTKPTKKKSYWCHFMAGINKLPPSFKPMKIPTTPEDFQSEFYSSIDLMDKIGDLRIRQRVNILDKVNDEIIISGIIKIFKNTKRPNTEYVDQKYAGKILNRIKPKTEIDLILILKATIENWNIKC